MPYTIAEHLPGMTEPLKRGAYISLIRESVIADMLSFRNTNAMSIAGERYDNVIEPEWIDLNEAIPDKTTRGKNLSYGVYQMAVHLDIPNPLERDDGVLERPSSRQAKMAMIGAAYQFNNTFVNGDQAVNPKQFDGIEKIVSNMGSSQSVGTTEIDISGAPTEAVMQAFVDRVDSMIDAVNGHKPDFVISNRQFGLRARSVFRRMKLAGNDADWLNGKYLPFMDERRSSSAASTKPMFIYQDIPFYDIGPKADMTTNIILNNYAEAGSSTATRVFAIKQGSDDLEGLQFAPPSMRKIFDTLQEKDVQRHRFTWITGLGMWSRNGMSVMRGVKVTG